PPRGLTDPAHHAAQCIADEDVVQTVAIEIGNGDVGNLRTLVALRRIADGTGGEQRGCTGGRCRRRWWRRGGRLWFAATTGGEAHSDRCDRCNRETMHYGALFDGLDGA